MNPQADKTGNLNLPPPVVEAQPIAPETGTETMPNVRPEAAPSQPEQAPKPKAPVFSALPAYSPPQQSNIPSNDVTSTTSAPSSLPAIADDSDLIEKEWVNKAKEIIEKNKADPHTQSKEITLVKADYMQKRYNKTLKLTE